MATKNSKIDKTTPAKSQADQDQYIVNWIIDMRDDARDAKVSRMAQNRQNFDLYHLRQDYSYKKKGQSRETLAKQAMAVEQISSFFQQSLVDVGNWFKVEATHKDAELLMKIKPDEIKKLLVRQQVDAKYLQHVGNGIKSALLGALVITKTTGILIPKPKFVVKKKKIGKTTKKTLVKIEDRTWQLKHDIVRQENYYPDPTGDELYEIEDMWTDLHKVKDKAKGENPIYLKGPVSGLKATSGDPIEDRNKEIETDQNVTFKGRRGRIKLTEYWGTILDENGDILHENIVATLANDKTLIRRPTANPLWSQKHPYTTGALLPVPNAVWPKALMDAPTKMNIALNEIFNLILDGGMKAVNAISQVRMDWLEDPSQVQDGLAPGTALQVNTNCPPGAKVAEPVITADVPRDAMDVMNLTQQEFNAAALTTDLRQGITPARNQSATATVETSNSITSIFQGVAKQIEAEWIQPTLIQQWTTMAQNFKDISFDTLVALFGKKRADELAKLDAEDIFADTVNGLQFKVFGISLTLSRAQDFRKLMQLLQIIGGSEILTEEFTKEFSFGRVLNEVISSLDIDTERIKLSDAEIEQMAEPPPQEGGEEGLPAPGPDEQSQQTQAGSLSDLIGTTEGQFAPGPRPQGPEA